MISKTLHLLDCLSSGRREDVTYDLLNFAAENKMLLELLRSTGLTGPLRERQESLYLDFVHSMTELSQLFAELDYALIKFDKAVAYVPSDIDFLVSEKDIEDATSILREHGYKQIVREPFCRTFRKEVTVDLYIHPCVANFIYLNGRKLLNHRIEMKIGDHYVKVLSRDVEAVLVASHAIYKEQLFTLNDCLTIKKWLSEKSIDFANETKTAQALSKSIILVKSVLKGELELPHKIGVVLTTGFLGAKFASDKTTRSSFLSLGTKLANKQFGLLLISRFKRRTY
jgi:hypothetical protein